MRNYLEFIYDQAIPSLIGSQGNVSPILVLATFRKVTWVPAFLGKIGRHSALVMFTVMP